jgi:hypothetical protein
MAFAVFLLLHLATTVSALSGPGTFDAVMRVVRRVYRPHLVVELLLVGGSAGLHIGISLLLMVRRWRGATPSSPRPLVRVHRWAGYVLLSLIVLHVVATRVVTALAGTPADFAFLAFSVLHWPLMIDPYYLALGAAGALHLALGLGLAATILFPGRLKAARARRVATAAAALLVTLVLGGVVSIIARADRADRSRYPQLDAMYRRYYPGLGTDSIGGPAR